MAQNNIQIPHAALQEFCERNHILKLSLFGSVLRDDFHAGSDVDMLVEFVDESAVGYLAMMRIQRQLSSLIGRTVDLRTPQELSSFIRDSVLAAAEMTYVHR